MRPGTPTLDQLRIFVAVTENGSFAAAGRRLGRATSAISYAINNLEHQLGVSLFERIGARPPLLTAAGRLVLSEARAVTNGIEELRSRITGLHGGREAELSLAVDVLFPCSRLTHALDAFRQEFPPVSVRLDVQALGAIPQLVLDGKATLGIAGPLAAGLEGIVETDLGTVEMIPVAAPDHDLARADHARPGSGRNHLQLVLSDRSTLSEGQDFQVTGLRTWRIADLGAKRALLLAGIGWGNMPAPLVADDLDGGRLVRLPMSDMGTAYPFRGIHRSDTSLGPAATWLLETLAKQSAA